MHYQTPLPTKKKEKEKDKIVLNPIMNTDHLIVFSVTIFASFTIFSYSSSSDYRFEVCSKPFECGGKIFQNATYPFWGANKDDYCGRTGFELACQQKQGYLTIEIERHSFRVLSINIERQIITVVNEEISFGLCSETFNFYNTDKFSLASTVEEIDLFNCTPDNPQSPWIPLTCNTSNDADDTHYYYVNLSYPYQSTLPSGCAKIGKVPILKSAKKEIQMEKALSLNDALSRGFDLRYHTNDSSCGKCSKSKGYCGYNSSTQHFRCFCNDKPHESFCDDESGINWKLKSIIGVAAGCFGVIAASSAWYLYHRRKIRRYRASTLLLSRNISSEPSSKSSGPDIEKTGGLSVEVHLFTYEELEQATNNFDPSKELGDGGYGTVYYGKLQDGREVAVKRLYEHNYKRVEQFMNEVEILTRLRHPNLVSLFGCTSRHSRELLLVYEYIPNGTLADHLHGERAKPIILPWHTRLKIAIETASALKYLHASDIIHRDVKSNNILLDRNFCVKVADFGLSRLFPRDKTHVSTAPQGTPGYLDPDYHQCYQLTNKSDVFSFGVVLMELISSMPAVDITRRRLEINLSNMAINKIQNRTLHEMVDQTLGFDSDTKVRQMVTAVAEMAYQCLQTDKDLRPCMSEVLETLLRIKNHGHGPSKVEEVDVDADDVVLMKSGPLVVQSPSTVMVKWDSGNSN